MTEPALLGLTNVSVGFGGLAALKGVSLSLHRGEVVSVIGPNGAGKTTLFNAITGFVPLSAGEIVFQGERVDGFMPHDVAARGVRRTFQNGGLCGSLTVLENVLAGLHSTIAGTPFAIALGLRSARRTERAAIVRARELLQLMGVGHLADQRAATLSGGQQRIVEIVRAIATSPPLILLDEPAVGLAPPVRIELAKIIQRLAGDGVGVLLIEHAIEMVMDVSDRIAVLNYGEKIAEDSPNAIRQNRAVLEAYLGRR